MCANTSCVESYVDTENRLPCPTANIKSAIGSLAKKCVHVQSVDDRVGND